MYEITLIKHIDGKQTIHFEATGTVKNADDSKCKSNISRVTKEEFNKE